MTGIKDTTKLLSDDISGSILLWFKGQIHELDYFSKACLCLACNFRNIEIICSAIKCFFVDILVILTCVWNHQIWKTHSSMSAGEPVYAQNFRKW